MSRTKSIFLGVVSSQVFMVITMLVSILSTPYILKKLDAEIYGLSIIIYQITAYLGIFDFGLTAGITRQLAGTQNTDEDSRNNISKIISTAFAGYIILGAIVAIVGNIIAPFVHLVFTIPDKFVTQVHSILGIICLLVGLQFILRCISGIFFAHQKQFLSNTMSFLLNISNTIFVITFVSMGYGLWSFAFSQICVFLINALLSLYLFNKHYHYVTLTLKNFDWALLKNMFSYGSYLFLNSIAVQIVFNTDKVVVGSIISLTAVTAFSLTLRLPELLTQFIWKIIDNSFPSMVEMSKGNPQGFKIAHDKIMLLTLSIASLCFWMVVLITHPFIKLWVGESYFAGTVFLFMVAYLYIIQHTFIHVTAVCLNGAGYAKGFSILSLFEAALNITLTIFLGKKYGIEGIVGATIIAGVVTSGWYVPYIGIKYMKSSSLSYLWLLLKPILLFTLFGAVMFVISRNYIFRIDNFLALILYGGGLGLYFCMPLYFLNKNTYLEFKTKLLTKRA